MAGLALSAAGARPGGPAGVLAQDADAAVASPVPAPEAVLGFAPGADRRLAPWPRIAAYLDSLARVSERVRIDTLGRSTLDRPLPLLVISDPSNLGRLERLRAVQARLADPRSLRDAAERDSLIGEARLVVLITAGTHPGEVGTPLFSVRLAHRLATTADPDLLHVLRETVILILPALNPDGVDRVAEWYRSSLDMPWEGSAPPFLAHHYAGHDLNRDWYAFTQRETRLAVSIYDRWHPQIVHDVHQQEATASRFFVPPWLDPVDPNVDPVLIGAANALGTRIAWTLLRQGRTGVAVHATYDAWSPGRFFPHYRNAVRILSETAGARLATPVELRPEDLRPTAGLDPRRATWNHPAPWAGGRWGMPEILDTMEAGALALLRRAAAERTVWLGQFVELGRRAVAGRPGWPRAWVIPTDAGDERARRRLLGILAFGGVELRRAERPFQAGARTFPAESWIVDLRQPYAAFAQTLLERQRYPEPPRGRRPAAYDGTAHTLPLLFGVEAVPVRTPIEEGSPVPDPPGPEIGGQAPGLTGAPGVLVGVYRPTVPSEDEGWTRWLFDGYAVPWAPLEPDRVIASELRRFSAVILPGGDPAELRDGWPAGETSPEHVGGLGGRDLAELQAFVREGGTLVALPGAAGLLVGAWELPVRDVLAGLGETEYEAPGALVRVAVDTGSWVGRDSPPEVAAWLEGGHAFRSRDSDRVALPVRYGSRPAVLSGWMRGADRLAGAAAVAEVRHGAGRIVLFGIRPQYRGQSMATFPLLWRALRPPPVVSGAP